MTEPSRTEFYARILIACRDHALPAPASISFHSADGVSMFVDTDYAANEWGAFLGTSGIRRDFYGWSLHLMVRPIPTPPAVWNPAGLVTEAVSDFESPAETFAPSRVEVRAGQCLVPYVRLTSADGVLLDIISECCRPKGHLDDHADGNLNQWPNEYPAPYAPDYRTVTP